jgi:outer membrane protein assembly factor BamB
MEGISWKVTLVAGLAFVGGGCSWFGAIEPAPLPGERLSVLTHAQTVEPDPDLAEAEILLPPPSPNPDWPQTGGYANHVMHHLAVGAVLKKVWDVDIGAGADDEERLVAPPIVADGMVYALDAETEVSAFKADNGAKVWSVDLTPDDEDDGHIGGGLAFENGRVFVTTGFAQVVALDAKTGKEIWRRSLDGPMRAAPTARGGRVFAITLENKLYALSGATGETLWSYAGTAEVASLLGGASPAVDDDVVVAPFSSGDLVALRLESGRVLWTDALVSARRTDAVSTLSQIRGRPIIDRGRVIAISHGDMLAAIDLRTGQRIWDKPIGGLESPWVAGDYVFLLTNDWELICLARNTGRVFWVRPLPRWEDEEDKEDAIIWTGPILASDRLIVAGSHGEALAVSPYDGRILGRQELPDGVSVAPIVANGTVYVLTNDASLVALR